MAIRYLFGPVSRPFGEQNLLGPRRGGWCKTFGPPGSDVPLLPGDTWDSVCARLGSVWRPDALVLSLATAPVPRWVWTVPVPVVGLATGWPLLWHAYRRQLALCDIVLADPSGAARLSRVGVRRVLAANLFGCERSYLEHAWPSAEKRDIDVLIVSNLPRPALRPHLPLLGRVARLGERWRVVMRAGVYGKAYRQLLGRARVLFNHSLAGECTYRAFEATASGSLLFQEVANQELPPFLRDRLEYVAYSDQDLEEHLQHYLANEPERRQLAEAARRKAPRYTWEALWEEHVLRIERELSGSDVSTQRSAADEELLLLSRCWRVVGQPIEADDGLARQLKEVLDRRPKSPALLTAWGLLLGNGAATPRAAATAALAALQTAATLAPDSASAALNLAEALAATGSGNAAVEQARRGLDLVEATTRFPMTDLGGLPFPPAFDTMRVEWERAAWMNSGDSDAESGAKQSLLRWRLNALVAEQTGELPPAYEAALTRPDLASSWSLLGANLTRAGQSQKATMHYRRASELDPLEQKPTPLTPNPFPRSTGVPPVNPDTGATPVLREEGSKLPLPLPASGRGSGGGVPPRHKRVSLTMIVRDEEHNLPACLTCVADIVDEIIIADTGSTDRTTEIAQAFGARVVEAPWTDDFASARNAALAHAGGAWVWWA